MMSSMSLSLRTHLLGNGIIGAARNKSVGDVVVGVGILMHATKSHCRHRAPLVHYTLLQFLQQFTFVLCVYSLPDHYHLLYFSFTSFNSVADLRYYCVHPAAFSSLVFIRHCHIPRFIYVNLL